MSTNDDLERHVDIAERERWRAVVAEFVAAYDEYNEAIGLNGTQAENEALLYRVTYRHGAAWKALRGLIDLVAEAENTPTAR